MSDKTGEMSGRTSEASGETGAVSAGASEKTFTLAIRFRCLCFFVPDRTNGRMHVLMPDTIAHFPPSGNGGHPHGDAADPRDLAKDAHGSGSDALDLLKAARRSSADMQPAATEVPESGADAGARGSASSGTVAAEREHAPDAHHDAAPAQLGAADAGPDATAPGSDGGTEGRAAERGNGGGHGHDDHKHVVRLQYPPFGDDDYLKLEGWELELGMGAAGSANPDLPVRTTIGEESEIVEVMVADLTPVTDTGIDRALIEPNPGPIVISRLILHAGSATDIEPDETWELDGRRVRLASELVWIIPNVPGESLALELKRLDEAREPAENGELPTLIPNAHGVVELRVFHVLERDFPPPLKGINPGLAAQHFSVYYDFYRDLPPEKKKLPEYRGRKFTISVGCNKARGELND